MHVSGEVSHTDSCKRACYVLLKELSVLLHDTLIRQQTPWDTSFNYRHTKQLPTVIYNDISLIIAQRTAVKCENNVAAFIEVQGNCLISVALTWIEKASFLNSCHETYSWESDKLLIKSCFVRKDSGSSSWPPESEQFLWASKNGTASLSLQKHLTWFGAQTSLTSEILSTYISLVQRSLGILKASHSIGIN